MLLSGHHLEHNVVEEKNMFSVLSGPLGSAGRQLDKMAGIRWPEREEPKRLPRGQYKN